VSETIIVVLVFAVLLGLEWRFRLRSVRLGTALLAVLVWVYAQPNPTRAARRALDTPPAERVTEIRGNRLSEYAIGVRTMERAAGEDAMMFDTERLLSVGVLFWLACSPVFRRAHAASATEPVSSRGRNGLASGSGGAAA